MLISGWGNHPRIEADVIAPAAVSSISGALAKGPLIARGMGRSYGDSAVAARIVQTNYLDHFLGFDEQAGLLTCQAGVTLQAILHLIVPRGWFLPVVPGTSHVSVGGAIASDVHGKNHHVAGTFSQHVQSLQLMLGNGDVVTASPDLLPDLFHATCGGMGLTGVILSATLKLVPLASAHIRQRVLKAGNLDHACELFERHRDSCYSVAWIDCLSSGRSLGRSVIALGEHDREGDRSLRLKPRLSVPVHAPAMLLNPWTISAFNRLYYAKARDGAVGSVGLGSYFFPLDGIGNWNRLYGKAGFFQLQFVLPQADGLANMRRILTDIAASGAGSFLAVLKQFGDANANLLSFPCEGYTLALDFKVTPDTLRLFARVEQMIVDAGGRMYLTKDALMSRDAFRAGYPRWEEFEAVRARYGAIGKFRSAQSQRLGLQ